MDAAARRVVVIAVDDYGSGSENFASGLRNQAATVTAWLAGSEMDAERRFTVTRPKQLTSLQDLQKFLRREARLADSAFDDALVVYITGHGVMGASQRHYLTFAMTDPDRLLTTAFPTSELITTVLDSEAEHVLILVDSCFAGALKEELATLAKDLRPDRRNLSSIAVITSGEFTTEPQVGEFTQLLQRSLDLAKDKAAGYTASHLSFEDWETLLNAVGDDNPGLLRAKWLFPDSRRSQPSLCLPNPHYQPPEQLVDQARRPVALTAKLADYWLSRASGKTSDDDPGWYFSGRAALMEQLVTFANQGNGVMTVTGAAGSGKSALLARLVTLSDPHFVNESRYADTAQNVPDHLRPRPGAVHAAVMARGKSALELLEDILAAFGLDAESEEPPLQVLLAHLQQLTADSEEREGDTAADDPGTRITIVIDALDEAEQPLAVLSDVIEPLAWLRRPDGPSCVRLVLGMRSSAVDHTNDTLQDTASCSPASVTARYP
ncbi:AAA family ATPase [Streptomyces sp. NPDC054835]